MDDKKVAFIICVNDMLSYSECKAYLEHLLVPEGFETDVIAVEGAPSMTAGYNMGMQSTDAKYKVYMHQDVLILNLMFISDMLQVFAADPAIALMGLIGAKYLSDDAKMIAHWDTGKVFHNCTPSKLEFEMPNTLWQEVEAVDGLLLATQMDTPWREEDSAKTLLEKVRKVKYLLKRVEFGMEVDESVLKTCLPPSYVIDIICKAYAF